MSEIKITEPSVSIIEQEEGRKGIFQMIEKAAKTTTQIDKISEDSEEWVNKNLIARKHMRPLEFGTVYLKTNDKDVAEFFAANPYSVVNAAADFYFITTNYRVLYENDLTFVLNTCMEIDNKPSANHTKRPTLMWDIGRDIADEFRTHTMISSIMESSRYCCYAKGRFDGITFSDVTFGYQWVDVLVDAYQLANDYYQELVDMGAPAEFARKVLPIGFRVHMMQSAFPKDWRSFFAQRADDSTGKAHPDAKYIANQAQNLLRKEL